MENPLKNISYSKRSEKDEFIFTLNFLSTLIITGVKLMTVTAITVISFTPENYANKEFLLIEIKSDILPFKPKPKRFI